VDRVRLLELAEHLDFAVEFPMSMEFPPFPEGEALQG